MEYYYLCLFAFILLGYFIVADSSVAKGFYLVTKIIESKYQLAKWWLLHNPANPVVKYMIWRRSMNLAKKLQREFDARNKE